MKLSHTIRPTFDDPNVVSDAGVVPALRLGESAGLYDLFEEALTAGSPNATAKRTCVVGGMLAGADSIDDLELVRHGGMGRLFGGIRAPSTLGTFLRSFTHGHTIRQVHGYAKQAAAYGYSGVRGLNIQLATVSTPLRPPMIARARLRKGNTSSSSDAPPPACE